MPASRPGALAAARGVEAASGGAGSIWVPVAAGLLHALLMFLAFPPVGAWPAALVAVAPLAWVGARVAKTAYPALAAGEKRRRRWARELRPPLLVTAGVMPLHLYEHQWLIDVTGLGYVPFAIGMSLFAGAFVWLLARVLRRLPVLPVAVTAAVLWTGLEVFRGEVIFTGYPWMLIAHPLIDAPLLAAPAAVLGTYFVSFLAAALGGVIAELALAGRRPVSLAAAWVVILGGFGLGFLGRARPAPEGTFRVVVVQTNVPQDNKLEWTLDQRLADFDRFLELTARAAAVDPRPDLIVWPETMFPGVFLDPAGLKTVEEAEARIGQPLKGLSYFAERLAQVQGEIGIPMLVGAVGYDNPRLVGSAESLDLKSDDRFNSVFLVAGGRVDPVRYDKMVLTPFGEVMPYVNAWPWLEKQVMALAAQGMAFDLSPGERARVFRIPSGLPDRPEVVVATPICFEATKAGLCRRLLKDQGESPRVLVNLTNDGWFGGFSTTRLQHLQIARWRALELATPVVRAANTGISTWISARGRVIKAGVEAPGPGEGVDGILIADTRPGRATTIYARVGDVFGWSAMGVAAALGVVSLIKRRTGVGPKNQGGSAAGA